MIRFLTAGESHGKALTSIIEGFPSNIPLKKDYFDFHLKRRQAGYGRSARMKIENDTLELLSGLRFGKTLGSPISLLIKNNDWKNWGDILNPEKKSSSIHKVSIPRPGHADLTGTIKYNFDDIRNSIERSSARETAARVAAGSVARRFLEEFGITVGSYVESIGGVYEKSNYKEKLLNDFSYNKLDVVRLSSNADLSSVRVLDAEQEKKIINKIKLAKKKGDSLGGTFVVIATGLPTGLGSFIQYDRKIDADIASVIMSINAVKGVEIGSGFECAESFGSQVHDEIIIEDNNFQRKTNRAGGVEGGITTGMPIIVTAAMKPIATLSSPLRTVDLKTMKKTTARYERSDFVAVPACSVIAESMLAWVIAKHFLVKFGGDSLEETRDNYNLYTKRSFKRIQKNFRK
ncbi:MAG: chorismate synthase [Ignavibacteriaceae bacterium]|nr:chorismate synthase [Ignavibacteriaceae bacterium]